jgi:transposase
LVRAKIVSLACRPPQKRGRLLVRWSVRELAAQAVEDGLVTEVHYSTVCLVLQAAELRPHRTRYWQWSQDPEFETKAASILWYYERAKSLSREGVLVVCIDEKTGIQALGRRTPDLPPASGRPRIREFEYVRYGVANLSLALVVPTGRIAGRVIPRNNSDNFIETLERLDHDLRDAKRIELVLDNGSSHISKQTTEWFEKHSDRFRPHFTPTHASWLDQAELALSALSRRYLRNAVFGSRDELIARIDASIDDYNKRYAHPFNWSFTRHAMHNWYERRLCPETCSTRP